MRGEGVQTQGLGLSDENRYVKKFIFLAMRQEAHAAYHLIEDDLCSVWLIIYSRIILDWG